jgi:hypothetical protein
VNNSGDCWKNGAGLVRMAANGYYKVELMVCQFINRVALVPGDINSNLSHRFDGQRIQAMLLNSR